MVCDLDGTFFMWVRNSDVTRKIFGDWISGLFGVFFALGFITETDSFGGWNPETKP